MPNKSDVEDGKKVLRDLGGVSDTALLDNSRTQMILTKIGEMAEKNPALASLEGDRGPDSKSHNFLNNDTAELGLKILRNPELLKGKISIAEQTQVIADIGREFKIYPKADATLDNTAPRTPQGSSWDKTSPDIERISQETLNGHWAKTSPDIEKISQQTLEQDAAHPKTLTPETEAWLEMEHNAGHSKTDDSIERASRQAAQTPQSTPGLPDVQDVINRFLGNGKPDIVGGSVPNAQHSSMVNAALPTADYGQPQPARPALDPKPEVVIKTAVQP